MNPSIVDEITKRFILLSMYRSGIERQLRETQRLAESRFSSTVGSDFELRDFNPFLAESFPSFLRYSFVALLTSVTESSLEDFCHELSRKRNLPPAETYSERKRAKKNCSNFEHVRAFLQCSFILPCETAKQQWTSVDGLWIETINFLRIIRNCIMHGGGEVSRLKRKQDRLVLEQPLAKWDGYSLKDGRLHLEDQFGNQILSKTQFFFEQLFTLL